MKLLNLNQRSVNVYGIDWLVPDCDGWMAADEDGMVCFYDVRPHLADYDGPFGGHWAGLTVAGVLGNVDLEGTDWKDTLVEVKK